MKALALLALLGLAACSGPAAVERPAEEPVRSGDFAAVVVVNCGEIVVVQFLSFDGQGQLVSIGSEAQSMDIQLRLADVVYERVFWIESNLDCVDKIV